MLRTLTKLTCLVAVGVFLAGCENGDSGGAKSSDGSAKAASGPQTFSEAVTSLVEMKNKIRDGFAAGDIDAAHGPLHEVGHTLNELAGFAAKEKFTAEKMTALKEATETLMDAFGEVDKTLHGGEGKTYEEVASTVDTAMKTITEMAGVVDDLAPAKNTEPEGSGSTPEEVDVEEAEAPPEDGK